MGDQKQNNTLGGIPGMSKWEETTGQGLDYDLTRSR